MVNFILIAAGLFIGFIFFRKFPSPVKYPLEGQVPDISVIIPMRNEASRIPGLLGDLAGQTVAPSQIICVDDESEDGCGEAARSLGAAVIRIEGKPADWTGKNFACHTGAQESRCGLLLFVDADVRMAPDALETIRAEYARNLCPISIQPYHMVGKLYEHFSLFLNMILLGSMGIGLPFPHKAVGFFGPVLLIPRDMYFRTGGHSRVRAEVLEDFMLGRHFSENDIAFRLFLGGKGISFRMYPDGLGHLVEGWTKNVFSGAAGIPPLHLLCMILLVTSYTGTVAALALSIAGADWPSLAASSVFYVLCVIQIRLVSRAIGNFRLFSSILFPVFLAGFHLLFALSAVKRLFVRNVSWKGRRIRV